MIKTNYHTHTNFCDGKNRAEEMLLSAIQKKFDILGFSGHSMFPFASDWHISSKEHQTYCHEINFLKEKYKNQIDVYLGFEADFIEGVCCPSFENYKNFSPDFLIGAVHYVPCQKGFFEADGSFEETRKKIGELFKGNVKKAVQSYFEAQRQMLKKGDFTFMAHPDLIRKQNSPLNKTGPLFSEKEGWYKKEVDLTVKEIARSGVTVEVNTGGMSRGYLDTPYPSPYFLEKLFQNKVAVTLNSDSHQCDTLDSYFDQTLLYIKKAGYKEITFFKSGHLENQKID